MKFIFLGDVHGDIEFCHDVSIANPNSTIIQVGDLGVGFPETSYDSVITLPKNFRFFVGNHDNRQLANTMSNCLGDFGDFNGKFFFVSGADSIDKAGRVEGVKWWRDEELNIEQGYKCMNEWETSKCDVLVCHDVPQSFVENCLLIYDKCLTRSLLQCMIEVKKPKLIISGHHHKKVRRNVYGIDWVSLGINDTFPLDI